MSTSESRVMNQAVTLVAGLVAVTGLMYASLFAMMGGWASALVVGVAELIVAWRVEPPAEARVLRFITALLGAVTIAYSILRLFEPSLGS